MQQTTVEATALAEPRRRVHPKTMLALLVFAQLADAATFALWVWRHGVNGESNAFAVVAYEQLGMEGLLILKGAAILIVLAVLVLGVSRYRRMFHMGAATATSIGLLGMLANVSALLLA